MEKFSIHEVIEQAVQTEKLGAKFYALMSERFKDDLNLKILFETLSAKELLHEKIFLGLKEKIREEDAEGWDEVSQYLRAIVESEFFLGKGKSLTSIENVKTSDDAIISALRFEKETLLYYHSIKDAVKEKNILDEIINEERSHIVWLSEFVIK